MVRKAQHSLKSTGHQVDEVKLNIQSEVIDAVAGVNRSSQDVVTSTASLSLAKEVAKLETLKYDNGRGDIDDPIAIRDIKRFRYEQTISWLLKVSGKPLKEI